MAGGNENLTIYYGLKTVVPKSFMATTTIESELGGANRHQSSGPCVQQASYLEGGPLMWMVPLYLHVNQKSDYNCTRYWKCSQTF